MTGSRQHDARVSVGGAGLGGGRNFERGVKFSLHRVFAAESACGKEAELLKAIEEKAGKLFFLLFSSSDGL